MIKRSYQEIAIFAPDMLRKNSSLEIQAFSRLWIFTGLFFLALSVLGRRIHSITRVYLGVNMNNAQRREIIDICNRRGIPYVGVVRNNERY